MGEPRPRGRDEVVEALLSSARRLVAERGPGVSLRDIADDAGVGFGLVYHYLGTKDQILDEVYRRAFQQTADRLVDVDNSTDILRLLATFGDGTTARLICWAVLEGRGSADVFRDAPAIELLVRRLVSDGDAAGAPISSEDARVFSAFVTAMLLGWRLFGPTALLAAGLGDVSADQYVPRLAEYLGRLAPTNPATKAAP